MGTRQTLLEIRRLFNEMLEEVVGNLVKKYPYLGDISSLDKEISFSISTGGMQFCNGKYYLVGDGEGSNPVLDQIYERNSTHFAPIISMKIPYHHNSIYLFHLDRTDTLREDDSFFIKIMRIVSCKPQVYYSEEILQSEDFKNCILQMVKDIAPDWLYKFENLFA